MRSHHYEPLTNVSPEQHETCSKRATTGQPIHSHSQINTLTPTRPAPSQEKGLCAPEDAPRHKLMKTRDIARGRWPGILQALGVESRFLDKKHGPCPICGGKDRYRFDDKEGYGRWICSNCGAGDGFDLLSKLYGWGFAQASKEVLGIVNTIQPGDMILQRSEESKLLALRKVWEGSKQVTNGDPVWHYLNRRIGIDIVPPDIRFHPSLQYVSDDGAQLGMHPAMVALMRYPDGKAASIHRTYLTATGEKARVPEPKKIMAGKPLKTASIRLCEVKSMVAIAEGIETALAASILFSVPVWAAGNATQLAAWAPPVGVKSILIAADNDENFTGQFAAYALAKRLRLNGFAVEVQVPKQPGTDWADLVFQ